MNVSDRWKRWIEGIVTRLTAKYDYAATYPCTVVAQNGDGTLELKPDSPNIPGMSAIPLRAGIPGLTIKVLPGARVLLGWENADPSRPFAGLWEGHDLLSLVITAALSVSVGGAGAQPLAHSTETLVAFQVLATTLQTLGTGMVTPPYSTTWSLFAAQYGAVVSAAGIAIQAVLPTLPTINAKGL